MLQRLDLCARPQMPLCLQFLSPLVPQGVLFHDIKHHFTEGGLASPICHRAVTESSNFTLLSGYHSLQRIDSGQAARHTNDTGS